MKPENRLSSLPAASRPQSGRDPVLEAMQRHHIPLTKEDYLDAQYPQGAPDELPEDILETLARLPGRNP